MADILYSCPQCASAAVEHGELVGSAAKCNVCGWSGDRESLLSTPFGHIYGTREAVLFELFNSLRKLMTGKEFMNELVKFLARWGFIDLQNDKRTVALRVSRYASTITRAMIQSLIEERQRIEKEEHNERLARQAR